MRSRVKSHVLRMQSKTKAGEGDCRLAFGESSEVRPRRAENQITDAWRSQPACPTWRTRSHAECRRGAPPKAGHIFGGKRVKGIEPSTFSLGSCGPEFEGTATSTVTDDAATTMRSACPEPCPDEGNMDQTADLVRVLSMLAELPLPDEVKVAALRKILRV
jgi:hypothetical protein